MTNQNQIESMPSCEFIAETWNRALWGQSSENTARQIFAVGMAQWGFNQHAALNEAELQKARDEELEACCALADERLQDGTSLRAARRPKPKSQAEEALGRCNDYIDPDGTIRAALERLRELEGNQ